MVLLVRKVNRQDRLEYRLVIVTKRYRGRRRENLMENLTQKTNELINRLDP